ncbi:MAG: ribonuclease H-like domain-containing protein [Fimbriimonadaceae bacterium]|nr:ribonuclease H-like domain-containing protein [Fimbriimonadaceae bacterium]
MLTRTFCHLPGLGAHTEAELWRQGCGTWDDFLEAPQEWSCGTADRGLVAEALADSRERLAAGEHQHFARLLGARHHWRCWPEFKSSALCLDIETDGGREGEATTMIGLYDGADFTCLTRDEGLGAFPDILSRHSMIVTFFGAGFDVPMLKKLFGDVFDQIHLDLCHAFRALGIRGGLKAIEKRFGLARVDEAEGLTGLDAIHLWRRWEVGGDQSAKDRLIAYNREDVVNLWTLADLCYRMQRQDVMLKARIEDPESLDAEPSPAE